MRDYVANCISRFGDRHGFFQVSKELWLAPKRLIVKTYESTDSCPLSSYVLLTLCANDSNDLTKPRILEVSVFLVVEDANLVYSLAETKHNNRFG